MSGKLADRLKGYFTKKGSGQSVGGPEVIPPKGVTNPEIVKLPRPKIPENITRSQFGKNVVGWGSRPQGALDRISSIDASSVNRMKSQGLTKEIATEWCDFYSNEFTRNGNNITAANRVKLMNKILENF